MRCAARVSTLLLAWMAVASLSLAQQRPEHIVSPEIAADGSVTFRIKAPRAA